MTTKTETARQVGQVFHIKVSGGNEVETECVTWTDERRVFKAIDGSGYIDLDWMEYLDNVGLGRITQPNTNYGEL